jgi:hypothetical protein
VKLAEREGFSLSSPKLNVFNGFELTPDYYVYQWCVLKSSSPPRVSTSCRRFGNDPARVEVSLQCVSAWGPDADRRRKYLI